MNPIPKGIPPKDDSGLADDSFPTDRPPPKRKLRLGTTCWIGISIVLVWLFVALFGPLLAPYPQGEMISYDSFAPMGEVGILGGDYIGRDIFSRLLFGARMTMGLALIATVLAFVVGGVFGYLAAAGGGWVDQVLSRLNDAIMAFPSIMLALIVIAALGTSIPVLIIMVCLIEATPVFRLTRALGMDISVMDFVEAARARGENLSWIVRREIFPNTFVPLAAEFGLRYTYAILFISALSFLGLGVQPPQADWGVMVRENMIGLTYGSPAAVIPAAAIGSLTVGINLIVDAFVEHGNRDVSEEMI
jgi:peptide/nickel transport system permease protein